MSFRKLGEREVYRGHLIQVAEAMFQGDGEPFERTIVHHPGAVSVVPVDGDDVVLVRQYRASVGTELLEIPAGKRDVDGEAVETTARRELAEEIGMAATDLEPLVDFYNSPGFCDEHMWIFLATGLTSCADDRQGDEEQVMTVERHPLSSVGALIGSGAIVDAKTIIGLLLAVQRIGSRR
ncbi:MAG TPA: NUDIX hydrolase [Acidimicrobiales bacterium]|nr:NUDIX hydrolase [Acidimicrobiales bacterium]